MIRALKIKENLRKEYEKELADYISHKDQNRLRTPATKRERRVFEELIFSYGIFLTGEAKERLLEVIGREHKIEEIRKKLKSSNPWRKRIATYQGGEFGLKEIAPLLLEQLKLKDRELLYITARALIKLEDRKYLKEILQAIGEDRSMEKNNVLVLVELVEGDIRDILEEIMDGSDSFLHALALEIYGKRQYMEGAPMIEKMVESPLKEIRIAALKGAAALGDMGDVDYFNKIAALKTDEQWEVRAFLAKYLKYVKNGHGIEILGSLMKDSNWHVRTNAANALKEQGEEGLKILVAMMDSEDGFAADKATEVIQKEVIFHGLLDNLEEGTIKNRIVQNMEKELMEVGENIYG